MQKINISTNQAEASGAALLWTHEQVAIVAEVIYEQGVRSRSVGFAESTVETQENLGKFLTLEVETGDYCLAGNMVDSILPLKQQYPLGRLFTLKVGYPTAASFGGFDDPDVI